MHYPNSRSSLYQETSVHTASPTKLVVMLYEGAIKALRRAVNDIRTRDLVSKHQSVNQAMAIVNHLRLTLNKEKARDIAEELDRLYAYVFSRILEGSTKLDASAIEEAIKVLSDLLPAWEEIAKKEPEQLAPPSALLANLAATGGFRLHA